MLWMRQGVMFALFVLCSVSCGPVWADTAELAWQQRAGSRVEQVKDYPRSAQIRGAHGTVVVRVSVDGFGMITAYKTVQSCAFDILNREAERALDRIGQFESTPGNKPVTFDVTVSWPKPVS